MPSIPHETWVLVSLTRFYRFLTRVIRIGGTLLFLSLARYWEAVSLDCLFALCSFRKPGSLNDSSHLQTEEKIHAACDRGGKARTRPGRLSHRCRDHASYWKTGSRSEEHTSELQSLTNL